MPELCRFKGMIIRIYAEDDLRHHKPHVHVKYGEDEISLSLDGEVIAGKMPAKNIRLVQLWLTLRADEVRTAWDRIVNDMPPGKIEPLKWEEL